MNWARALVAPRTVGLADVLGFVGTVGFAAGRFVPFDALSPWWGCSFRRLTGIPCPGCGLTRVATRLAHLDFYGAWIVNPLGFLVALTFAGLALYALLHLTFGFAAPSLTLSRIARRRLICVGALAACVNYAWVLHATLKLGVQ